MDIMVVSLFDDNVKKYSQGIIVLKRNNKGKNCLVLQTQNVWLDN